VNTYPATVDVRRELVPYPGRLLAAERRARGTRPAPRASTRFSPAPPVPLWFRTDEHVSLPGAGLGICRATAYR
jgi:hypothetical protein